ncbi:hypothetical protein LTR85_010465 [Meristemomyces frigidus]|nr:hypothetical protein LTR85_010465 [Meristemomyces frigidus]
MPPRRGKKRKTTTSSGTTTENSGNASLTPPDRATWPGWVEMESEPAFFNVMLREMGVRGAKIQEVFSIEDTELAMLPRPIHALIFLFRYHETEKDEKQPTSCPKHVWFANQTPDFACATFALLNIVNNIPDLDLGRDLRNFKDFTQDMDPLSRGDAVDSFEFVKHIHNSFARESDLLQSDMYVKNKADKLKKRQALARARETREAKKLGKSPAKTPLKEVSANGTTPSRASDRTKRPSPKKESSLEDDPDGDFGAPPKSSADTAEPPNGVRRSKREPKPRTNNFSAAAAADAEAEEGFHFVAYIPIKGHVWKLDGLDRFPQDMGSFSEGEGGEWMTVAQLELMGRMAQYQDSEIMFNLMAVVHDPLASDRKALLENVKALRTVDRKLDSVYDDWRDMEGAETKKDVITDFSLALDVSLADVDGVELPASTVEKAEKEDDLLKLIDVRKDIVTQQAGLRATVRLSLEDSKGDDEKARHRRHDYGSFLRSWLGALADQEVLSELVEGVCHSSAHLSTTLSPLAHPKAFPIQEIAMCFKTQYSYAACGCPADKPAAKNLRWVHHCDMAMNYSPFRPYEDSDDYEPTDVHLRGLCGECMLKPKHNAKAEDYRPSFETQGYQAYQAECQRQRLENPLYYHWPQPKPKSKKEGASLQ